MKRYVRNSLLSVACVYLPLWLLAYQEIPVKNQEPFRVRQVETATLRPPVSPPVTMSTKTEQQTVSLNTVETAETVSIKISELDISLPETLLPELNEVKSEALVGQYHALSSDDIVEEMLTFSLDELDEKPRLLSRITARIPKKLVSRGVKQARIHLHVVIHENGQVEILNIVKVSYPMLKTLVPDIARQARFTSPIRHGKQVKAEFLWPIIINA